MVKEVSKNELAALTKKLTRLTKLGREHDAGKRGHRYYLPLYEKFFARLREEKINLLEIGVGLGGSLRMWQEYFSNVTVTGMDIEEKEDLGKGIKFIHGDQCNDIALLLKGRYDIIIDDASHRDSDMQFTFGHLYPRLNSGGIYVLEDMGTRRPERPEHPKCPRTKKMMGTWEETGVLKTPIIDKASRKRIVESTRSVTVAKRICFIEKK